MLASDEDALCCSNVLRKTDLGGLVASPHLFACPVFLNEASRRGVVRYVDYVSVNVRRNFQRMVPTMVTNCALEDFVPRTPRAYIPMEVVEVYLGNKPPWKLHVGIVSL